LTSGDRGKRKEREERHRKIQRERQRQTGQSSLKPAVYCRPIHMTVRRAHGGYAAYNLDILKSIRGEKRETEKETDRQTERHTDRDRDRLDNLVLSLYTVYT